MLNERDREKVNRHLHKVMGKCWHEQELVQGTVPSEYRCTVTGCGDYYAGGKWRRDDRVDYCSDLEHRALLNGVVAKARTVAGLEAIMRELEKITLRKVDNIFELKRGAPRLVRL